MPDDIKIKISADGAAQTAEQLSKVTKELENQRKTRDTISKAQEQERQKRQSVIDQLKKEAAEVNSFTNTLQRQQVVMMSGGAAFNNVAANTQKLKAQLGPVVALLGNVGGQFANLIPQTGLWVSSLRTAGSAFGQMLGLLGGGPGVLLGGAVAAIGLIATAMSKSADEADKLAESIKKNSDAMKEYIDGINNLRSAAGARITAASEKQAYEKRFGAGELTSEEYAIERQVAKDLYAQRHEIDKKLKESYLSGDIETVRKLAAAQQQALAAPYRGEQARVFEQQAREREANEAKNAYSKKKIGLEESLLTDKKGNGKNPFPDYGEVEAQDRKIRQMISEEANKRAEIEYKKSQEVRQAEANAFADKNDREMKAMKERWAWESEQRAMNNQQEEQEHAEHMRKLAANHKMYQDLATQSSNIIAGTAIKSFQMVAKGQKAEVGAILEGIGDQIVAMGTGYIFKGIAESILLNPQGPALIGVGTAAVGFGIGLGAAGARAPGGSAPGNGGFDTGKNPFSPRDYQQPSPLGESRGPTVININMPTVVSPTAEDGRRIQEALDAKARVYG